MSSIRVVLSNDGLWIRAGDSSLVSVVLLSGNQASLEGRPAETSTLGVHRRPRAFVVIVTHLVNER